MLLVSGVFLLGLVLVMVGLIEIKKLPKKPYKIIFMGLFYFRALVFLLKDSTPKVGIRWVAPNAQTIKVI